MRNFWGELVARLRVEQRISQRVLAARARVNRNTLRRIERGEAPAEIDVMERLLHYLGYELEAMERTTPEERLRHQARIEDDPERRSRMAMDRILAMNLLLT